MLRSLLVLVSVMLFSASLAGQPFTAFELKKSLQQISSDCDQSSANLNDDREDSDGITPHGFWFTPSPTTLYQHPHFEFSAPLSSPSHLHIRGPPRLNFHS